MLCHAMMIVAMLSLIEDARLSLPSMVFTASLVMLVNASLPTNFSVFRRAWKDTRVQLQCGQLLSTQSLVTGQRVVQPLCSALSTVLAKYVLAPLGVCSAMIQPGATCQRLDLQPCSQTYAVLGQYVIPPAVVHSFWVLSVATCQRPESSLAVGLPPYS